MDNVILFLLTLFLSGVSSTSEICHNAVCRRGDDEPVIRFPFRITNRQTETCGYPGFNLSCNTVNQTELIIPKNGKFILKGIDYAAQQIWINDPDHCLAKRILSLDLSGGPFTGVAFQYFYFFNCSLDQSPYRWTPISCLSGSRNTVYATADSFWFDLLFPPSFCSLIKSVLVPVHSPVDTEALSSELTGDLVLKWEAPACGKCEARGGRCGFKTNSTSIGCSNVPPRGIPRSARYAITVGAGIPTLLCIFGLFCFICGWIKSIANGHHQSPELNASVVPQPTVVMGLDRPTLESYPKILLGESRRLPGSNDSICPICLCEYRPKEILRSIPQCMHCFHHDCIDEWLSLNASCPICRNSPRPEQPPEVSRAS